MGSPNLRPPTQLLVFISIRWAELRLSPHPGSQQAQRPEFSLLVLGDQQSTGQNGKAPDI